MRVAEIYRYPVKGLSPERLDMAALETGRVIAGDRRYAIENGPSGFDPATPRHLPKIKYLMLMRNEQLASLDTHFDDATTTLSIRDREGGELARGDLSTPQGRAAIEVFFSSFMAEHLRGMPRVVQAEPQLDPFSFSDVASRVVSLINLASVRDLGDGLELPLDPLRFRGNLHLEDVPAWEELDMLGQEFTAPSGARLKITKRIVRCAATSVDPATAIRGLDLPRAIMARFGHMDCGVYAQVTRPGAIRPGDVLTPLAPRLL